MAGMLRRTAAGNGTASNGNGRYQPGQSDGNREVAVAGELPAGNGIGRALGRIAPAAGPQFPTMERTLTLTLAAA